MITEQTVPSWEPWIGCDVAKNTFDAALYLNPTPGVPQLRKLPVKHFERTARGVAERFQWVKAMMNEEQVSSLRVCMESTGSYSTALAKMLLQEQPDCSPAIVNPYYVKQFGESLGQRTKNDPVDARSCAIYGATRRPAPWIQQDPVYRKLMALARERKNLVAQRTALLNRNETPAEEPLVVQIRSRMKQNPDQEIKVLEQAIETTLREDQALEEDAKRVCELPGVASVVTATVFSELGDLRQYLRGRGLTAMVGLNPKELFQWNQSAWSGQDEQEGKFAGSIRFVFSRDGLLEHQGGSLSEAHLSQVSESRQK